MSGSGWEAVPDVRELMVGPHGWSGVPPGCPGVVGRPSRVVGWPSQMSGSGQETVPDVR